MKCIKLTQDQVVKVDDCYYDELSKYDWYAWWNLNTQSFYAVRMTKINNKRKSIYMHRVIMNAQSNQDIDHKNHDTLDNQCQNLRLCTKMENRQNSRKRDNCSSIYKGVHWYKQTHKWQVYITFEKHKYHLGYFVDEYDAALNYDAKARELFGEFALTNF